jgi:hypothetical protein
MSDDLLVVHRPSAPSTAAKRDSHTAWLVWAAPLAALAFVGLKYAHLIKRKRRWFSWRRLRS